MSGWNNCAISYANGDDIPVTDGYGPHDQLFQKAVGWGLTAPNNIKQAYNSKTPATLWLSGGGISFWGSFDGTTTDNSVGNESGLAPDSCGVAVPDIYPINAARSTLGSSAFSTGATDLLCNDSTPTTQGTKGYNALFNTPVEGKILSENTCNNSGDESPDPLQHQSWLQSLGEYPCIGEMSTSPYGRIVQLTPTYYNLTWDGTQPNAPSQFYWTNPLYNSCVANYNKLKTDHTARNGPCSPLIYVSGPIAHDQQTSYNVNDDTFVSCLKDQDNILTNPSLGSCPVDTSAFPASWTPVTADGTSKSSGYPFLTPVSNMFQGAMKAIPVTPEQFCICNCSASGLSNKTCKSLCKQVNYSGFNKASDVKQTGFYYDVNDKTCKQSDTSSDNGQYPTKEACEFVSNGKEVGPTDQDSMIIYGTVIISMVMILVLWKLMEGSQYRTVTILVFIAVMIIVVAFLYYKYIYVPSVVNSDGECVDVYSPQFTVPPAEEVGLEDGSADAGPLKRGWYDLSNQGVANDYCRYIYSDNPPSQWVCALASDPSNPRRYVVESLAIFHNTSPQATPGILTSTPTVGNCPTKPSVNPRAMIPIGGMGYPNTDSGPPDYIPKLAKGWYDVFNQGAPNDYCFYGTIAPSIVGTHGDSKGDIIISPSGTSTYYTNLTYFLASETAILYIDQTAGIIFTAFADYTPGDSILWSYSFGTSTPGPYYLLLNATTGTLYVTGKSGNLAGWKVMPTPTLVLVLGDDGTLSLQSSIDYLPIGQGGINSSGALNPRMWMCNISSQQNIPTVPSYYGGVYGRNQYDYPTAVPVDENMAVFKRPPSN